MSIFLLVLIGLMIGSLISALICLFADLNDCDSTKSTITAIVVGVSILLATIFIGIGLSDDSDRAYVQKYLAQKQTIEYSLRNDNLSGLERIDLVNKAIDINAKFAKKKAEYERWHHVHFDYSIYDGIELINLEG